MAISFIFLILLALAGLLALGGLVVMVLLLANEKTRVAGVVLLVAMLIAGRCCRSCAGPRYGTLMHVQPSIAPPPAVQMPPMPMPPMPMPPMPPMPPVETTLLPDAAAPPVIEALPLDGRIENEPSVSSDERRPRESREQRERGGPSADAAAAGSNASEPESEATR